MSIRSKLLGMLMGVSAVVLIGACIAFVVYDFKSSRETKMRTMSVLAEAIANAAYGPSAFEDEASAKTVLSTLNSEPTALRAAIYIQDGQRRLAAWGDAKDLRRTLRGVTKGYSASKLTLVQPVSNKESQVGTLLVEFGVEDLEARTQTFLVIAAQVMGGALLLAFLAVMIIHPIVSGPVGELARAANLVRDTEDYSLRATKVSSDELGMLTDAFNEMLSGIEAREQELEEHRGRLEEKVAERTAALNAKNREMAAILDNVDQGFVMVEPQGRLADGRSAAFDRWFGVPGPNANFSLHMRGVSIKFADWFDVGLDDLSNGFIPSEVVLAQMPASLEVDGRSYEFDYKPLVDGDDLSKVLVVANDVTERRRREAEDTKQREYATLFDHFVKDPEGLMEFYDEASRIVASLADPALLQDVELTQRQVHTLKGNCSLFGVETVVAVAHKMETKLSESAMPPTEEELSELQTAWVDLSDRIEQMVGRRRESVVVPTSVHTALVERLQAGLSSAQAAEELKSWRHEAMAQRLERVARQVHALALRLNKGTVDVQIEDNNIRVPPERWAPFWTAFAHVVRNAVDHGLESKTDMQARGCDERPTILLRTFETDGVCRVEISDNGRGIAWERVAEKAEELGLSAETTQDLEARALQRWTQYSVDGQ